MISNGDVTGASDAALEAGVATIRRRQRRLSRMFLGFPLGVLAIAHTIHPFGAPDIAVGIVAFGWAGATGVAALRFRQARCPECGARVTPPHRRDLRSLIGAFPWLIDECHGCGLSFREPAMPSIPRAPRPRRFR
jgi:hypothetical protein